MATQIGKIIGLDGKFFAKDASGDIVELKNGDAITSDMIVYGDSSNLSTNSIEIAMQGGRENITLFGSQEQAFDSSLTDSPNEEEALAADAVKEALDDAIYAEADATQKSDTDDALIDDMDTAAGEERPKTSEAGEGEFEQRDGQQTDVVSSLRSAPFGAASTPSPEENNRVLDNTPEAPINTPPSLSVVADADGRQVLLVEDFEGINKGSGDTNLHKDWYVDHGSDGDAKLVSLNNNTWEMNAAGIEMRIDDGVHRLDTADNSDTYVELDAHTKGLNSSITTSVNLQGSEEFELSFNFIPRPGAANSSDMTFAFAGQVVNVNVDSSGAITFDSASGVEVSQTATANGWTTITAKYTDVDGGANDSASLTFAGAGTSNTLGAYIDRIILFGDDTHASDEVNITDSDDTHMELAVVTLINTQAGDDLEYDLPADITVVSSTNASGNIELTLSGHATIADYESALESITLSAESNSTGREISYRVFDGDSWTETVSVDINNDVREIPDMPLILSQSVENAGYDQVLIEESATLDFDGVLHLNDIEELHLGEGLQDIDLTLDDVFNMTETNDSGINLLNITTDGNGGNANPQDIVRIDTAGWTQTAADDGYTYTNDNGDSISVTVDEQIITTI